jgi:hypothetical protein
MVKTETGRFLRFAYKPVGSSQTAKSTCGHLMIWAAVHKKKISANFAAKNGVLTVPTLGR